LLVPLAGVMTAFSTRLTASARIPVESSDDLIFRGGDGGSFSRTNFRSREWVPTLQTLGLGEWEKRGGKRRFRPAFRFHDLKHFGIAAAIAVGAHPKDIQVRAGIGRSARAWTCTARLFDADQVNLADRLDDFHDRSSRDRPSEVVSVAR